MKNMENGYYVVSALNKWATGKLGKNRALKILDEYNNGPLPKTEDGYYPDKIIAARPYRIVFGYFSKTFMASNLCPEEIIKMEKQQFQSLMTMAKTFQEIEPDRSDFWRGFQRGLRRLYHGENFGTETEHQQWMNCADGDYRKQSQDGYRAGYHGENPLTKETPQ